MLLLFTILLVFILLSRIIETTIKIPTTLSLIILSFLLTSFFPDILSISKDEFDEILYLMLPVILLPDILNISTSQLKKHYKEIIYLALVAVTISIVLAVIITPFLLPQYQFKIGMLIALFSMLMATDAITVASIMSKFKLPQKLKIYAESESLFNDVTALIIYYFIALPMISGGEVTVLDINLTLVKILVLSVAIGMIIAFIGYYTIKIVKNSFDQFIVIYLIVILSFMTAEHFHIAGILSIVTSVLVFKYLIKKEMLKTNNNTLIDLENDLESSLLNLIKKVPALSKKDFREYKKEAEYVGVFANAIVFTIVAIIIDFDLILSYSYEIAIVFILTTLIRIAAISPMIMFLKLPFRWAKALTFSGTKGALAIIMVHSLPDSFIYQEMFNAIVTGVVLLTTFLYTIALMIHIKYNENGYKLDLENSHQDDEQYLMNDIVEFIEKDTISGAYTQSFIEEIMDKEIQRSQRYKTELSFITLELRCGNDDIFKRVGSVINSHIRTNDYFGRFENDRFIILTANTSLSGAMTLVQKIEKIFEKDQHIFESTKPIFGITQLDDTDTLHSVLEKLEDALNKIKNNKTKSNIEIEA